MRQTLQPTLALLDEGARLYRRHFLSFSLIAAIFCAPAFMVALVGPSLISNLDSETGLLLALGIGLGAIGIALLMLPPLARATRMALAGAQPTLRAALLRRPRPLRAAATVGFGALLLAVLNIISAIASVVFACPLYFGLAIAFGGAIGISSGGLGAALGGVLLILALLLLLLSYLLGLTITGAAWVAALFGLQPLLDDELPIGAAIGLCFELTFARLGHNLLVFLCAAFVFGAISLSVSLAAGVLLPLPLGIVLGAEHDLVRGLGGVAWLIGLALAAPLPPIWTALRYRQLAAERDGAALAARLAALGGGLSGGPSGVAPS